MGKMSVANTQAGENNFFPSGFPTGKFPSVSRRLKFFQFLIVFFLLVPECLPFVVNIWCD
jgi:hypothetical protein